MCAAPVVLLLPGPKTKAAPRPRCHSSGRHCRSHLQRLHDAAWCYIILKRYYASFHPEQTCRPPHACRTCWAGLREHTFQRRVWVSIEFQLSSAGVTSESWFAKSEACWVLKSWRSRNCAFVWRFSRNIITELSRSSTWGKWHHLGSNTFLVIYLFIPFLFN